MEVTGTTDAQSTTNLEVMQMLLQAICGGEGRPLPVKYKQGTTPLHMACARGNVHAVQELLKYIEGIPSSVGITLVRMHAESNLLSTFVHRCGPSRQPGTVATSLCCKERSGGSD